MNIVSLFCLAVSPILIDGEFDDWPTGITHQEDSQFIYELIQFPQTQCLQQLPKQHVLELGDYVIYFSPTEKGYGVSCNYKDSWISPYAIGLVFAPTTASKQFEVRINKPTTTQQKTSFDLAHKGEFRVVSWNIQFGNLLDDKERSGRILKALEPDVLLLQELDGDDESETIGTFLHETLGGSWSVGLSDVSGTKRHHKLRCAVTSSKPTHSVTRVGEAPLKAILATIDVDEKPIHFVSLHLRCCGGPSGEEEDQRQEEAHQIRNTLDSMQNSSCIIAGDWNLVGTMAPLEIVQSDTLQIVNACQPDGRCNATWSDESSAFTPGRLDWMLYSPATLQVVNSFILDSSDFDSDTLQLYHLNATDTAKLSDHLPLVADFKVLKPVEEEVQ